MVLNTGNKKHVVIFLPFLTYGGAEKQGLLLAKALQQSGLYTVQVIGFSNNTHSYPLIKELQNEGINYEVLPFGMYVFFNRVQRIKAIIQFTRLLRAKKVKVLIPFTWWPNYLSAVCFRFAGVEKCFWNQRSVDQHVPQTGWEKLIPVSRLTFVSNSNPGKKFIAQRFGIPESSVHVINNGVTPAAATGNTQLPIIDTAKPVCLTMLANFYPEKDVFTVIKGIGILKNKGYRVKMQFVGNAANAQGEKAKALAFDLGLHEQVVFVPQVENVEQLLLDSNVGVLSSSSEGCPNSVLEYISYRLPVLASNIEAISDVTGTAYPYLFALGNEHDFAEKAAQLINSLQRGDNSAAETLFKNVLPDYTITGMVAKFVNLINQEA